MRITLIFSSPRLLPKISNNNRRKFKLPPHGKHHPIVFKKAEDIAGYKKTEVSFGRFSAKIVIFV